MRYRFCVISLITIILTFVMCPFIKTQSFVYADSTTDQWESVTTNAELAEAFRYYCKSRNLSVEGSALDAVTSFTTSTFNNLCNTVGVDITALQANLKKSTDSNGKLQFLFDSTGISTYNRLFAEFLQNNNLDVGDVVDQTDLYSGKWFVDADGNGCLVYVFSGSPTGTNNGLAYSYNASFSSLGSDYKYSTEQILSLVGTSNYTFTFNLTNTLSKNITLRYFTYTSRWPYIYTVRDGSAYNKGVAFYSKTLYSNNSTYEPDNYGRFIITQRGSDIYLCEVVNRSTSDSVNATTSSPLYYYELSYIDGGNANAVNVYITTNNQTINNNNYEGDTIINNEGDTGGESGGGESGGGESGGDTNIDIDFPDFNFPNIPNIDFNLGDLSHKFPFSIPFDLVAFFTVLNADPIAPSIDRTIPLPDPIDDWHFQADFSQFDNYAVIIRNVEYIGFVIGLIYLTVRFVKG